MLGNCFCLPNGLELEAPSQYCGAQGTKSVYECEETVARTRHSAKVGNFARATSSLMSDQLGAGDALTGLFELNAALRPTRFIRADTTDSLLWSFLESLGDITVPVLRMKICTQRVVHASGTSVSH